MADVPIKFRLTVEEKAVVDGLNKVESGMSNIGTIADRSSRSVATLEATLARLGKTVSFHGSRNRSEIAGDLLGRMNPATASRIVTEASSRTATARARSGLQAEALRRLEEMRSDPELLASSRSRAMFTALRGSSSVNRRISAFARQNEIGDVDNPEVRAVAQSLMTQARQVRRTLVNVLKEAGGSQELVKLAQSQGVPMTATGMRGFMDKRASSLTKSRLEGTLQNYLDRNDDRDFAEHVRMNRDYSRGVNRASYRDRLLREEELKGMSMRRDTAGMDGYDERLGGRYTGGSGRGYRGGTYSNGWTYRRNAGAAPYNLSDGIIAMSGGGSGGPPVTFRGMAGGAFRGLRGAAGFVGRNISGVAGLGAAAIYAGNGLANEYASLMEGDFSAVATGESRYRSLMGMSPGENQRKIRASVRDRALAFGVNTDVMSSFMYDIKSSAGELADPKNSKQLNELMDSVATLHSVAGGDLPTLGQGLISFSNIYGKERLGGYGRAGGLFKAAADYGKFSTTTLAQLGPDAMSYMKEFGISPEDALATLSVGSLSTGRPENFMTGNKYMASKMGDFEAAGITSRGMGYYDRLRAINAHAQTEAGRKDIENITGHEGFISTMIASRNVDEIERVSKKFQSIGPNDIANQRNNLVNDPTNAFGRIAQSIESYAGQASERSMDETGDIGRRRQFDAISIELAKIGQGQNKRGILALASGTNGIDLLNHQEEYTSLAIGAPIAALMAKGHTREANALAIGTGQDTLTGNVRAKSWIDNFRSSPNDVPSRLTDGADAAKYLEITSDPTLAGMKRSEFIQRESFINVGRHSDAKAIDDAVRARYASATKKPVTSFSSGNSVDLMTPQFGFFGNNFAEASEGLIGKVDSISDTFGVDSNRSRIASRMKDQILSRNASLNFNQQGTTANYRDALGIQIGAAIRDFDPNLDKAEYAANKADFAKEFASREAEFKASTPEQAGYEAKKARYLQVKAIKREISSDGIVSNDEYRGALKFMKDGAEKPVIAIDDASIGKITKGLAEAMKPADPKPNAAPDSKGKTTAAPVSGAKVLPSQNSYAAHP